MKYILKLIIYPSQCDPNEFLKAHLIAQFQLFNIAMQFEKGDMQVPSIMTGY